MLIALSLLSTAQAEEAKFEGTKSGDEFPKAETRLTANLGGNFVAGNSESINFNAGFDLQHKWRRNQIGLVGGAAIGSGAVDVDADGFLSPEERCIGATGNDCQPTTEKYNLDLRYDRFVSKRSSLYLLLGGLHDKFGGYDLRAHGQLGVAHLLVNRDKTHLKIEIGVDAANEDFVEGVEPNSQFLLALQAGLAADHAFNDNVSLSDTLVIYDPFLTMPEGGEFAPSFADVRITNTATITAKMTDRLSVSVSDAFGWRNLPVAPPEGVGSDVDGDGYITFDEGGRSHFENTLTVALVASIL